jgi:hypothetical protein
MNFGYHISSETYYYNSLKSVLDSEVAEKLHIGFYEKDGGTDGEFSLSFSLDSNGNKVVSNSTIFTDGYNAFLIFLSIIQSEDLENLTFDTILSALKKSNAVDFTKRKP